jgi:hypothetical protein
MNRKKKVGAERMKKGRKNIMQKTEKSENACCSIRM